MRPTFARLAQTAAQAALGLTLVAIPFRYRQVLLERPLYPVYGDYTNFLLFPSDVGLLLTLGFWLISLALAPRRVRPGPFFLAAPIAGFTLVGLLSIFVSVDPALSVYHGLRLVLLAGLYLYLVNEIESLKPLLWAVALQVLLQAVVGIGQSWQQHSLGLSAFGELTLDPARPGVSVVGAGDDRFLRAYGLTDHPNLLGGCLAFALVALAAGYAAARAEWRPLLTGAFALGLTALFLTFSRSAWLALGGGLGAYLLTLAFGRHKPQIFFSLGLVAAGVMMTLPFMWRAAPYAGLRLNVTGAPAVSSLEERALNERQYLAEVTNEIFSDHAGLGIGLGALPTALRRFYPQFPINYQPAHVALLEAAAETGILGAIFYSLALTLPWLVLWRRRRVALRSPELLGLSALLLALTVVGFFDYYTWLSTLGRMWQWLAWGVWGAQYQKLSREQT
jgi:O-antigen ligase